MLSCTINVLNSVCALTGIIKEHDIYELDVIKRLRHGNMLQCCIWERNKIYIQQDIHRCNIQDTFPMNLPPNVTSIYI